MPRRRWARATASPAQSTRASSASSPPRPTPPCAPTAAPDGAGVALGGARVSLWDFCGCERGTHAGFEELITNYCQEKLRVWEWQHTQRTPSSVREALYDDAYAPLPPALAAALAAEPHSAPGAPVVDMLERQPTGVLPTIEVQSKAPGATDVRMCVQLAAAHGASSHWVAQRDGFVVRHYATGAAVSYKAEGFPRVQRHRAAPRL